MTLISSFQTDTISVIRSKTSGYHDDDTGMYVNGKSEKIEMVVAINPATGKDLKNLPESQRTSQAIKVYSNELLVTANENISKKADCIEWRGCDYQVQNVEDWTNTDIPHYKSIAVKVENDSSNRVVTI